MMIVFLLVWAVRLMLMTVLVKKLHIHDNELLKPRNSFCYFASSFTMSSETVWGAVCDRSTVYCPCVYSGGYSEMTNTCQATSIKNPSTTMKVTANTLKRLKWNTEYDFIQNNQNTANNTSDCVRDMYRTIYKYIFISYFNFGKIIKIGLYFSLLNWSKCTSTYWLSLQWFFPWFMWRDNVSQDIDVDKNANAFIWLVSMSCPGQHVVDFLLLNNN